MGFIVELWNYKMVTDEAQKNCTLLFQFFGAFFASKG